MQDVRGKMQEDPAVMSVTRMSRSFVYLLLFLLP